MPKAPKNPEKGKTRKPPKRAEHQYLAFGGPYNGTKFYLPGSDIPWHIPYYLKDSDELFGTYVYNPTQHTYHWNAA